MTRDQAIEIARCAATRSDEKPFHDYQPTPETARNWMPHEWVIEAIMETQKVQASLDTNRLDWMEAHPRSRDIIINGQTMHALHYVVTGAPGIPLRDIIDVVMKKTSN